MRSIFIICMVLLPWAGWSQSTPVISQYMFNGLPLNPAVTGSRDALTFQMSHRDQWTGVEGAPRTETFAMHAPLEQDRLAVGLLVYSDRLGVSRRLGTLVNAAFRLRLQTGVLSFGLAGGGVQSRHRWQDVSTQQDGDEVFDIGTETQVKPEFSAGIYYYTNQYYFSVSSPMFMQSITARNGRSDQPGPGPGGPTPPGAPTPGSGPDAAGQVPIMVNAGMRIQASPAVAITPSMMVRSYAGTLQLDVNMMALVEQRMEFGFSYRTNQAIVVLGRFRATDQIHIGYAYDVASGLLAKASAGSHEVTLSYDCRYKTYTQNPRFF